MRAAVAMVVLLASAGGCGDTSGGQARVARADAEAIAWDAGHGSTRILEVRLVGGDVFFVKARGSKSGRVRCVLIDLSRFERRAENDYAGIAPVGCDLPT